MNLKNFLAFTFLLGNVAFGENVSFKLDSLNRITNITYSDGASISYSYDSAGNRLSIRSVPQASIQDLLAPTTPDGFSVSDISSNRVFLQWSTSLDTGGSGLAGYKIYQDGVSIATTTSTNLVVNGLNANTQYCFSIVAYDNALNVSLLGTPTCVTTLSNDQKYSITLSVSPPGSGTVSGEGTFSSGSQRTIGATPNNGVFFNGWTENGNLVSTSGEYSFSLITNRVLVASFKSITTLLRLIDSKMVEGKFEVTVTGQEGKTFVVEASDDLLNWTPISTNTLPVSGLFAVRDVDVTLHPQRFYRLVPFVAKLPAQVAMVYITAGSFTMGDAFSEARSDDLAELPTHTVNLGSFFMDRYDVTKASWDDVFNWAITHGYIFDNPGLGKGPNHPVHTVSWQDSVKWCNARSEKEGLAPAYYTDASKSVVIKTGQWDLKNECVNWTSGYRLPTEAEWEKAARGGLDGKRFPLGDTISQAQANYSSTGSFTYNLSPLVDFSPVYNDSVFPYTSPVGSFPPNGFGLYDMAGNVYQWCWDRSGPYQSGLQNDPHGPDLGSLRLVRGGVWSNPPNNSRVAYRGDSVPTVCNHSTGLRCVLSATRAPGTVVSWGGNNAGQTSVPAGLTNVIVIAAGGDTSLAVKTDGTVVAWGAQTNVPPTFTNVMALAAADTHILALRIDGTVVAWDFYALGLFSPPVGLSNVIAVAGGSYTSLALKSDGTVVAWGSNFHGETNVPLGLSNVVKIAGGEFRSIAVKIDGTVVEWGNETIVPVNVTNLTSVALGICSGLALTRDKLLWRGVALQVPSCLLDLQMQLVWRLGSTTA